MHTPPPKSKALVIRPPTKEPPIYGDSQTRTKQGSIKDYPELVWTDVGWWNTS